MSRWSSAWASIGMSAGGGTFDDQTVATSWPPTRTTVMRPCGSCQAEIFWARADQHRAAPQPTGKPALKLIKGGAQ